MEEFCYQNSEVRFLENKIWIFRRILPPFYHNHAINKKSQKIVLLIKIASFSQITLRVATRKKKPKKRICVFLFKSRDSQANSFEIHFLFV